jgi:hypothetical protein
MVITESFSPLIRARGVSAAIKMELCKEAGYYVQ